MHNTANRCKTNPTTVTTAQTNLPYYKTLKKLYQLGRLGGLIREISSCSSPVDILACRALRFWRYCSKLSPASTADTNNIAAAVTKAASCTGLQQQPGVEQGMQDGHVSTLQGQGMCQCFKMRSPAEGLAKVPMS